MKRTLVEILSGLAVLVLLASFHHQIARLKVQNQDVAELREMVRNASAKDEVAAVREQVLRSVETRLRDLEVQIREAALGSEQASRLRHEIQLARAEVDKVRTDMSRDVTQTRALVDAFHNEFREKDLAARATLTRTQTAIESLATRVQPDPERLTGDMLAPTVQLNGDDTVGSGTLIYSARNAATDANETWVITSYHVVRNILADTPSARREGVHVTIYDGKSKIEQRADLIAHDEKIDAAVLKLRGDRLFANVAHVLPRHQAEQVKVWDPVWAVGCPLGNDPIPTQGEVSSTRNELNGVNYWMINAPTYFGNSGGGVYLASSRELIGVFSKIYTHGKGNPVVIPHMGLCTPIDAIYKWLDSAQLGYLLEREEVQLARPDGK